MDKENKDLREINTNDFFKLSLPEDKIKFLLGYAILAPSTHNSQPWLFKIGENFCEVYYERKKLLPQADPKGRDLYISLGCAIENLVIAAKYFNVFQKADYGPFREENLVAKIYFSFVGARQNTVRKELESLLSAIPRRINARGIFKDKPVDSEIKDLIFTNIKQEDYYLDDLETKFVEQKDKIREIASLSSKGIRIAYQNPLFRKEMSDWLRSSFTSKKDGLPGYALKMPAILSLIFPTIVRFGDVGKFLSGLNEKSVSSAPMVCVISARGDNPLTWFLVGRLAERLMLEFNKHSYDTSIFVAAIEMGELYKNLQSIIGTTLTPQFLFAVGKIDTLHKPTPRHSIESKMIK